MKNKLLMNQINIEINRFFQAYHFNNTDVEYMDCEFQYQFYNDHITFQVTTEFVGYQLVYNNDRLECRYWLRQDIPHNSVTVKDLSKFFDSIRKNILRNKNTSIGFLG